MGPFGKDLTCLKDRMNEIQNKIVIYGAGGHAKVVFETIQAAAVAKVAFLVDANPGAASIMFKDHRVYNEQEGMIELRKCQHSAFVAIGNNAIREKLIETIEQHKISLSTIIHPSVILSKTASVEPGTLLMPRSVINADVSIGKGAIINTAAIVEHDVRLGNYSHVGPGAILCGGVSIGDGTLIGAGSIILPGVKIGSAARVGAGAVVTAHVPDRITVKGSPARP